MILRVAPYTADSNCTNNHRWHDLLATPTMSTPTLRIPRSKAIALLSLQRYFGEMGPVTVLTDLLCPLKMARIGGVKRPPPAGSNS